ncbi:unnamed protein product [Ilex paraguariensis]|uniref:Uncharacterized protein n=1 Tax=Ilex paraguariensis TaxID=185542 RepID=A0ABC8RI92_9AQUA
MTDLYNVEAAEKVVNEALLLPISEAMPIYEQLLSTFPTASMRRRELRGRKRPEKLLISCSAMLVSFLS